VIKIKIQDTRVFENGRRLDGDPEPFKVFFSNKNLHLILSGSTPDQCRTLVKALHPDVIVEEK
jgi:hypothetical protein